MSDRDPAWSLIDRELVYSGEALDVVHDHVELPDSSSYPFEYVSAPGSVVILPFTPNGDVVTITEWRQAVDRYSSGLPAGTIEPTDEGVRAAARRELREETGYTADRIDILGAFEPANGSTDFVHTYCVAHDCRQDADPDHQRDETISIARASMESLLEAIHNGELRDGRSAFGLLLYASRR